MQRSYTRRQLLVLLLAAVLIVAAALTFFLRGGVREPVNQDYVAVIRIDGTIYGGQDGGGLLAQQQGAASERVMKELRQARLDPHAKAVLLRINSSA